MGKAATPVILANSGAQGWWPLGVTKKEKRTKEQCWLAVQVLVLAGTLPLSDCSSAGNALTPAPPDENEEYGTVVMKKKKSTRRGIGRETIMTWTGTLTLAL